MCTEGRKGHKEANREATPSGKAGTLRLLWLASAQFPVGITVLPSIMRMTVRSGALVRCTTPFGTVKPCWENSSTERSAKSIISFPETT
jgi:hypothetical protein